MVIIDIYIIFADFDFHCGLSLRIGNTENSSNSFNLDRHNHHALALGRAITAQGAHSPRPHRQRSQCRHRPPRCRLAYPLGWCPRLHRTHMPSRPVQRRKCNGKRGGLTIEWPEPLFSSLSDAKRQVHVYDSASTFSIEAGTVSSGTLQKQRWVG